MPNDGVQELVPTPDECTYATLAHVLQLVGGWIAPLIIFLVKRNSRFVSFHALQALLLQGLYFLLMAVVGGAFFVLAMASAVLHNSAGQHAAPSLGLIFSFGAIWLVMMGWWVFILIVAIVYGIKAGRGQWVYYPVLGRLACKILKLGPIGEA
jgi:uncharacterized protein